MNFWDWLIVIVPFAFVYAMAMYSRKYIRSVADFLSAGRVCGRYVINMGSVATALSITGIISTMEMSYKTGFALNFWGGLLLPITVIMGLTGYFGYRWRETKAMSLGQFLEMRYSRKLRIFAATLRTVAEVIANSILPAVAARFFITMLDIPRTIDVFGFEVSTFVLIMILCLFLAISILCMGGTLALIITDSLQGFFIYPIMAIFAVFVLVKFDWDLQIVSVLQDRAPEESFINPFDVGKLRDFNMLSIFLIPLLTRFLHAGSWIGAGYDSAAKSPHEAKMGGLLGTFRNALFYMFGTLFAIMLIVVFNHKDFSGKALEIRNYLCSVINEEPLLDISDEMKSNLDNVVKTSVPIVHEIGKDTPLSHKDNPDETYLAEIRNTLVAGDSTTADLDPIDREAIGNATFQQYKTYYHQLSLPAMIRGFLPHGMIGLFCLMMVMAMVSTDDSVIYSAALTFTQDVLVPLLRKEPTLKQHIRLLRISAIGVGLIYLLGSIYMKHLIYINIFVTIVTSMWMGGCGPVLIFGMYSRFGTTAGAWASLLTGMFLSFATFAVDRWWASDVYPWLQHHELVEPVGKILKDISDHIPWVEWEMNPLRCPINGYEFYLMIMIITIVCYIAVSYATLKKPFNLDRMLHRGKYNLDGEKKDNEKLSIKNIFRKLLGITPEFSKGDKVVAWIFFLYAVVYQFAIVSVMTLIWNIITPWPIEWWSKYFYITNLVVPGILAAISTVWLGYGGIKDLIDVFRSLENRVRNHLDNGSVSGNMSLADKAQLEAIDSKEQETDKN